MRGPKKRGSLRRPNPRGNRVSFIFCDFFIKKTPDSRRHAIPALRPYTLPVKNSPGGQPHLPQITPKGGYILQFVKIKFLIVSRIIGASKSGSLRGRRPRGSRVLCFLKKTCFIQKELVFSNL